MPNTVIQSIDGMDVEFTKLTRRDCIAIVNRVFESTRAKLIKDLDDAHASPEARETAIAAHREYEGTDALLLRHVKTMEGADEVIRASAGKLNGSAPNVDAIPLRNDELIFLAARLTGFRTKTDEELAKESEENLGYSRPQKSSSATG